MTLNIILAVVCFIGVSTILVIRKGWKTALIITGILLGMFIIVSGAIGLLF